MEHEFSTSSFAMGSLEKLLFVDADRPIECSLEEIRSQTDDPGCVNQIETVICKEAQNIISYHFWIVIFVDDLGNQKHPNFSLKCLHISTRTLLYIL